MLMANQTDLLLVTLFMTHPLFCFVALSEFIRAVYITGAASITSRYAQ
jgi:hypothetical protein